MRYVRFTYSSSNLESSPYPNRLAVEQNVASSSTGRVKSKMLKMMPNATLLGTQDQKTRNVALSPNTGIQALNKDFCTAGSVRMHCLLQVGINLYEHFANNNI